MIAKRFERGLKTICLAHNKSADLINHSKQIWIPWTRVEVSLLPVLLRFYSQPVKLLNIASTCRKFIFEQTTIEWRSKQNGTQSVGCEAKGWECDLNTKYRHEAPSGMNQIKKSKEETMIGVKRREIFAFVVLLLMPKNVSAVARRHCQSGGWNRVRAIDTIKSN